MLECVQLINICWMIVEHIHKFLKTDYVMLLKKDIVTKDASQLVYCIPKMCGYKTNLKEDM